MLHCNAWFRSFSNLRATHHQLRPFSPHSSTRRSICPNKASHVRTRDADCECEPRRARLVRKLCDARQGTRPGRRRVHGRQDPHARRRRSPRGRHAASALQGVARAARAVRGRGAHLRHAAQHDHGLPDVLPQHGRLGHDVGARAALDPVVAQGVHRHGHG